MGVGRNDIRPRTFLIVTSALGAHADGLFPAQTGIGSFDQHVREGVFSADRRTEHSGLAGCGKCLGDSKGDNITAVSRFGTDDGDAGKTHGVSYVLHIIRVRYHIVRTMSNCNVQTVTDTR